VYEQWLSSVWRARLDRLAPVIVEHVESAERRGRLATPVVSAMREAGVNNLYLPRSLGGEEVDPVTCALITESIAQHDAAAAWFVMVANSPRLLAASWPAALVEMLWQDNPHTLIAASGNTLLTGEVAGTDLIVSGKIGFASGCHHADWVAAPCVIPDLDGQELRLMVLMRMEQCQILDDWDVLGMRGTGSNTVAVARVRIPRSQAVPVAAQLKAANPYYEGALYRCPGRVSFATYVPISLAIAQRALAALDELARVKVAANSTNRLRERSIAQAKFGKALAIYRAARGYFLDALREAWERAQRGEITTDTQRADLYLAGTHGVQASAETVRLVADVAGTSAIFERGKLARVVRDMEVLRQHGFASENRYASVSQQYWGATLDYPLLLR